MDIEHDKDCDGCNIIINCGGKDHDKKCNCPSEFAEAYSHADQTLFPSPGMSMPGQIVLLENLIHSSPAIDTSAASTTGIIKINLAGWYDVTLGVTGALNPLPSPLPCWTVSLFKNGTLVPASTFANTPISPEQKVNQCVSDVFVHIDAGDELYIANTSTSTLFLTSPTLGTNATVNSATIKIQLIKADHK